MLNLDNELMTCNKLLEEGEEDAAFFHLWQGIRAEFINKEQNREKKRDQLIEIYKKIFGKYFESKNARTEKRQKRLFIFCHQLLGLSHAPTKVIKMITDKISVHFEDVFIISLTPDLEVPVGSKNTTHYFYFNFVSDSESLHKAFKTNEKIKISSKKYKPSTVKSLINDFEFVSSDTFISVGTYQPLFDSIKSQRKYFLPLVPKESDLKEATTGNYSIDIFSSESEKIARRKNIKNEFMEDIFIGYPMTIDDDSTPLRKKLLILNRIKYKKNKSKTNIFIAGNRLQNDLSIQKNIELILEIVKKEDITVSFIGWDMKLEKPTSLAGVENISFYPFDENLEVTASLFDAFLDLFRDGNGTISIFALKNNLPIIAPEDGHVYSITKTPLKFNTIQEASIIINNIKSLKETASVHAKNRLKEIMFDPGKIIDSLHTEF